MTCISRKLWIPARCYRFPDRRYRNPAMRIHCFFITQASRTNNKTKLLSLSRVRFS